MKNLVIFHSFFDSLPEGKARTIPAMSIRETP
jgi:hypothetical protein